jgi:hypothetical protein
LSIAFDDPPMEPDPEWVRVDTMAGIRVRSYTIDRGRPTEFDKTGTGTAVIQIVDRTGVFDPTNTSSPLYNKAVPGKQAAIALLNPVNDTWHTIFRGYIESWSYRLGQTREHMELELQLVDGFAVLSRAELRVGVDGVIPGPPPYTSPPYATPEAAAFEERLAEFAKGNVLYGETLGYVKDRIDAVLGDAGWPIDLTDTFSGNVRVGPKAYGAGTTALDALWDAVDAEIPGVGNCFMDAAGKFRFRGRQARFRPDVAEYGIQRRTVGDPSAWAGDTDVVPVAELEWSNGEDNLFNACTATPEHVGTGDASRPINPDEPDNDDVAGQLVQNPTSITAYGRRSLTFDNLQTVQGIATGNDAMAETKLFSTYYVDNYGDAPHPRVSRMVFKTRRPGNTNAAALWQHFCNCEISDLLTLKSEHPGGGGFDTDFYVEGIHYQVSPGPPEYAHVELSLDVSPRAHYTTNPFDGDPDPGP